MKGTAAEKQFAFWLTTQTNARGLPYKPYVASRYAACLRTEPLKLDISLSVEERDTYRCQTLQEFDRLNQIFHTAPNFREVDQGWGHGAFSAGLSAYRRYVHYLESPDFGKTDEGKQFRNLPSAENETSPFSGDPKRVDFANPDVCTGCDPVSCVVEGKEFHVHSWRDILTELTEHFLATKPRAQELTWRSIYRRRGHPFLLKDKPSYAASRQISNGYWVYLNLSISNLVFAIGRLCVFCDVKLEDVDIRYVPKRTGDKVAFARSSEFCHKRPVQPTVAIPDALLSALKKNYAGGFRFEATSVNLLASASGIQIDNGIKVKLKNLMFGRKDGVYFLPDQVADEVTRIDLLATTDTYLRDYGCFEISEVYQQFEKRLNSICIKTAEDFESYYLWAAQGNVRCVAAPQIGNRIVRYCGGSVWETFDEVAKKIVIFINERHYGSCTEEELYGEFSAFSKNLLGKIVRHCASDELVSVEINDTICYQSFAALGLPENFSEILSTTLERLEEIGLSSSQETLHTALSLDLGVNFKTEFSLPDWDTYRRLIRAYYKGQPRREWKNNIFVEVDG